MDTILDKIKRAYIDYDYHEYHTVTELSSAICNVIITPPEFNILLETTHLQIKKDGKWIPTNYGNPFSKHVKNKKHDFYVWKVDVFNYLVDYAKRSIK